MVRKNILEGLKITVFTFIGFYLFLTVLYCLPRILVEYTSFNFINKLPNYELFDLEEFSKYLIGWCAVYSGAGTKLGTVLNINKKEFVDQDKIKVVLILLVIIFVITYCYNLWLGHRCKIGDVWFEPIKLPRDNILTALGATGLCYLGGCEGDDDEEDTVDSDNKPV